MRRSGSFLGCCAVFALSATMIGPRAHAERIPAPTGDRFRFVDTTRPAGLTEPLMGMMGHAAAWGDFDADGLIDLYVGGFCDRPSSEYWPAVGPVPNRLFRNLGNGRFEPAKQPAVEFYGRTSGAVFVDLDGNGTLELYVANNARPRSERGGEPQRSAQLRQSQLFRNDRGTLVDVTAASGACPPLLHTARNIGVLDFDGNGLLDLLVLEDRFVREGDGPRSVLLRNLGDLRFEVANRAAGLPDDLYGLGLAVADLNGDGRPDFFVGHSNRLFLSQPNNSYREALELRDVFRHEPLDAEDWPCGAAFGDFNRDGRLDLVVTAHHAPARNRVFLNEGLHGQVPQFREVTEAVGLGNRVPTKCPHVEIQDFDNDGWPDISTSAAWRDSEGRVTPLIYRNEGVHDGLPRFVPPQPIGGPMVYYPAGPSGDYDNDGRLDLFLVNWFQGDHSHLLRNESPPQRWLNVQVVGRRMNRMGIGAKVHVYQAGRLGQPQALLGYQEVSTGFGFASGQPAVCHFGLGDQLTVDVLVTLPSGTSIQRPAVAADQVLIVEEP